MTLIGTLNGPKMIVVVLGSSDSSVLEYALRMLSKKRNIRTAVTVWGQTNNIMMTWIDLEGIELRGVYCYINAFMSVVNTGSFDCFRRCQNRNLSVNKNPSFVKVLYST